MAKLFVEDVVVKRLRGGKFQFGLVVTNYETYDSSDEDSDHEGHPGPDEYERINEGQVRVAWYPKGNEEVVDDSKVTLHDRSLMPGDVIYSMNKCGATQCGFVRSVSIQCHIRIFKTKQMIYNVDSRDLQPIMALQHGDHVVLGFWLGTVRDVSSEVVIKLQNGARYVLSDEGASRLTDVHDKSEEFSVFSGEDGYYPGQVLHGPSSAFKKAKWLSGTKPIMGSKTNFRGTVEKVRVTSVEVDWLTRGVCLSNANEDDEIHKPPDKKIDGDKVKELQVLKHLKAASTQIGDKAMYTVKSEQVIHPQHVTLGSIHCFKQPELTQKATGKQSQKEDPRDKRPRNEDPQEIDSQEKDSQKDAQEKYSQEKDLQEGDPRAKDPLEKDKHERDLQDTDPSEEDPQESDHQQRDIQETDPAEEDPAKEDTPDKDPQESDHQESNPQEKGHQVDGSQEELQSLEKVDEADSGRNELNKKLENQESSIDDSLLKFHLEKEKTISKDDTQIFEHQEQNMEEGLCGDVEDNDEGKCAEARADAKELPVQKEDSKIGSLDVARLRGLHQQLLETSDDIAKIGRYYFSKKGGRAGTGPMKQHIVKLLQARDELKEHAESFEDLIEEWDESPGNVKDSHTIHHKSSTRGVKPRSGRTKKQPVIAGEDVCVEVTHTSTVVDVTWQDGTTEKNIRSSQLVPMNQVDELEFFPGDFVSPSENVEEGVYGLVTSANHEERICTVKWYKQIMQPDVSVPQYTETTEASVYDLVSHGDFTFNTGDVVVRVGDIRDERLTRSLPCAGQVLWMNTDGTIEIMWVDHSQSNALPQDIYKLEEDSDSDWSDNEEDDDRWHLNSQSIGSEGSWETASDGSDDKSIDSHGREEQNSIVDEQNEKNKVEEGSSSIGTEFIAVDKNKQQTCQNLNAETSTDKPSQTLNSKLNTEESSKSTSESSNKPSTDAIDIEEVDVNIAVAEGAMTPGETVLSGRQFSDDEAGKLAIATNNEDSGEQCSKFISIESVSSEHAFAQCVHTPNAPKKFISTVRKEISLLQCSLPVGILVKAFEDRMDLFSVLIEGPRNTPYEDALFYFDVRLPTDYPSVPPLLHYHSYCTRRLNPNLYEDGKVCISLLGTWTGKSNEMWNSKSTLLQVLVSIQGLILVAEPYYNEAGFEKHRGSSLGEENSQMYNETTLLKVVQSMTKMLRNPPTIFKDEVIDFCRKHNQQLIDRIENWLKLSRGLADSKPGKAANKQAAPTFPLLPFSKGFLLSIQQALKALKSASTEKLST